MKFKNFILGFLIIGALGTLCHFVYSWSGNNTIIGYFNPVNESTWEHLKLLFFPTLLFSAFEYFLMKEKPNNFPFIVALSLFIGLLSIVTIFYTYSGILGFKIEWFNIAIYYIALFIMLIAKAILTKINFKNKAVNIISLLWIFIMSLMFVFATYNPLDLGIFEEP